MKNDALLLGFLIALTLCVCKERQPETIISVGLTIEKDASLRLKPDSTAKVLKQLEFATPFFILERRQFMEEMRVWHWYKVVLIDRKTKGWIISKEGREGSLKVVDLDANDFAGLYFLVAEEEVGYHEYEAAESLFKYVLNTYGSDEIRILERLHGDVVQTHANMAVLRSLSNLESVRRNYRGALDYSKNLLTQNEATRRDSIAAAHRMMRIYLNASEKGQCVSEAIRFYRHIIRDFPNEKLVGYEGHVWLDIEAAEYLIEVFAEVLRDTNGLQQECTNILAETSNSAVSLIATQGIVVSLLHNDEPRFAKVLLEDAVKRYPDERRHYFKGSYVNYTYLLIGRALGAVYAKYGYSQELSEWVESLESILANDCDIIVDTDRDLLLFEYITDSDLDPDIELLTKVVDMYGLESGKVVRREAKEIERKKH
jgi:hypothetical protein